MKISTVNVIMSVMVLAIVACSSVETPHKKKHAARKAPVAVEAIATPAEEAPATACVSCGAAGALATINTSAGEGANQNQSK